MAPTYDVVVAGLGVTGSAAADALARRGLRVLGLDRFAPPHPHGSSHGHSRVIREAYFEHALYVPMVRRAFELWDELARASGKDLFVRTGLLSLGPGEGTVVAGARRSARTHDIAHEELTPDEVRARWPVLAPPAGAAGLYETRAGLLHPERCVAVLLDRARQHGAAIRLEEPVLGWKADARHVQVHTAQGAVSAGTLIVSAGAWASSLLRDLQVPLTVERQVMYWFTPARDAAALRAPFCPVVLWEHAAGRLFYTTPDVGEGVKAALHHDGETTSPDVVRAVDAAETARARALLAQLVPAAGAGTLRETRTCLYTNTPDGHFLIDRHPAHRQVLVASPCSGHGFKFGPAVGEALADMVTGEAGRFDLAPFALARLAS